MKIAKYNDINYEFIEREKGFLLLSNSWQQDFEIKKIEDREYYAKCVPADEIRAAWETYIAMSVDRTSEKTKVDVSDTPSGYMVEFIDREMPPAVSGMVEAHSEEESGKIILFSTIVKMCPDATFWKIKTDLYDFSTSCTPVSVTEAVAECVKITKISSDKEIVCCPKCSFSFPLDVSTVPFGEVYKTECPVCGK